MAPGRKAPNNKEDKSVLQADYLTKSLPKPELIKRLKVATGRLESYEDDDEAVEIAKREIGQLSAVLSEDWLMKHKDKDVRLLVACGLADTLRIYAPDPPYDESTNAEIIKLFIKMLRAFESPDMNESNGSYSIHFYLLDRLSNVSIFSMIPELINHRDELLLLLANSFYSIVGGMTNHSCSAKIAEHMQSILCNVMEEMESYTVELFDVVVVALCQGHKKDNPKGCDMMKAVIAGCPNNLQPFVERELHQVKAGFNTESELTQGTRLSEVVFELGHVAPRVLTQVLPAYADDLTVENPDARIIAIKLLGALFSIGNFYKDFAQVFAEFKRRANDKDSDVRRAMVSVMQALISKKPELGTVFMHDTWTFQGEEREAPMRNLMLDADEKVRKDTIEAVVELSLTSADIVPASLMQLLGERLKDRKLNLRQAALTGLAKLYHKYVAPYEHDSLNDAALNKFGWIPSKMLLLYTIDRDSRQAVARCIEDVCLSIEGGASSSAPRAVAEMALDFWCLLDDKGAETMATLLKNRQSFGEGVLKLIQMRDEMGNNSGDLDEAGEDDGVIDKLSKFFPDPAKAQGMLRKLAEIKTSKVWEALEGLVLKPQPAASALKIQEETLKRLGPKSSLLESVKAVINRICDRHFGVDLIEHICSASAQKGANSSAVSKGLSILPVLARANPRLLWDQAKNVEALLTKKVDDNEVISSILRVVFFAGESLEALSSRKPVAKRLKELCSHESWAIAKDATRALISVGGEYSEEIRGVVKHCLDSLEVNSELPSVMSALTEAAKRAPDLLSHIDRDACFMFVTKSVLTCSVTSTASKKADKQLTSDIKILGLKLVTGLLLGQEDPATQEDNSQEAVRVLEDLATPIVELLAGICADKETSLLDKNTSKTERPVMRLSAGSCLLKIAKVKHLEACVKPDVFLAISRLAEDDSLMVRSAFFKKVFKGTAQQSGKLPFRFASMLALGAHLEAKEVETCKNYLQRTVQMMRALQSKKSWTSLVPEHLLPWLAYLLANNQDHLDEKGDVHFLSLSMKKYLDLFIHACLPGAEGNSNFLALLQIFAHIKQCEVKWDAAAAESDPALVQRNVVLLAELGHKLVKKAGESKKWNTDGITCSISKIVEGPIFKRRDGGAHTTFSQEIPLDIALSPIRNRASPSSKKGAAAAKPDAATSKERKKSAGGKSAAAAKKAAHKGKGRKRRADLSSEEESEEEEKEQEEEEEQEQEEEKAPASNARRSISRTMEVAETPADVDEMQVEEEHEEEEEAEQEEEEVEEEVEQAPAGRRGRSAAAATEASEGSRGGRGAKKQKVSAAAKPVKEDKKSKAAAAAAAAAAPMEQIVEESTRRSSVRDVGKRASSAKPKATVKAAAVPAARPSAGMGKVKGAASAAGRTSTASSGSSKRASGASDTSVFDDFDIEEAEEDEAVTSTPPTRKSKSSGGKAAPPKEGKENDTPPGAKSRSALDKSPAPPNKAAPVADAGMKKRARGSASHFARPSGVHVPVSQQSSSSQDAASALWSDALSALKPNASLGTKAKKKRKI